MTVAEFIDYLNQFPMNTRVILSEEDTRDLGPDEKYIELAYLDYAREVTR